MSDWNTKVIDEFRSNDGRVGGMFEGMPLLLLHHVGARTGTERISPLVYRQLEDGVAIFASKAGSPSHPDWYHNVKANPIVTVEIGSEVTEMKAREVDGEERAVIWNAQKIDFPQFAEYETRTNRQIPVFVLEV